MNIIEKFYSLLLNQPEFFNNQVGIDFHFSASHLCSSFSSVVDLPPNYTKYHHFTIA